ncbi:MAG: Gfo/Idh/MocA family oxidoreductase [Planctomycetota bacterium]
MDTSNGRPANLPPAKPIRLGIAGLGRSGWNIHAKTVRTMPHHFAITAVMDPDSERRKQAERELGCRSCERFEGLIADDVDAVVVASPSSLHAEHSIVAADAGKHIVAEKPFGLSVEEADRMIEAATAAGVVLAPFQNRRYEAHYRKVLDLVRSGALGEVLQIRMCWHRFTRRWDWQALKRLGGGALYNNGTHLLDQAMEFVGDTDPEIFVDVRRGLSVGDADEHMKLILRAEGGPTIDLEYTNASAFEHERWHVMGTAGGLRGTAETLEWKTVDWSKMPERTINDGPAAGRLYPSEDIAWEHHRWDADASAPAPYELFYRDFAGAISRGTTLLVTPESARRYLRVLERCADHIERQAEPHAGAAR